MFNPYLTGSSDRRTAIHGPIAVSVPPRAFSVHPPSPADALCRAISGGPAKSLHNGRRPGAEFRPPEPPRERTGSSRSSAFISNVKGCNNGTVQAGRNMRTTGNANVFWPGRASQRPKGPADLRLTVFLTNSGSNPCPMPKCRPYSNTHRLLHDPLQAKPRSPRGNR